MSETHEIKVLARNKKAFFNYTVEETLECGVVLIGTEVKSIKDGKFAFADSYCRIRSNRLELYGFHVSEYKQGNIFNHEPVRVRTLLAHKDEIKRFKRKVDEKGFTLVPLRVYLKRGLVKVEIGLCRGKKVFDKRETIRARDQKRDEAREMKGAY
jgi:SsrA-binding protein